MKILLLVCFSICIFASSVNLFIWNNYISIYIGDANFATGIIFSVIFFSVGAGAWIGSIAIKRTNKLLTTYSIIQLSIAILSIAFELFYNLVSENFYLHIIHSNHANIFMYLTVSLMIAPVSLLIGCQFPLMLNTLLRINPNYKEHMLGLTYLFIYLFSAIGLIISKSYFIEVYGLPGTTLISGISHLVVSLIVWFMAKKLTTDPTTPSEKYKEANHTVYGMYICSAVVGATTMFYINSWLRMLQLNSNSYVYPVEYNIATILLGLALGSYVIKNKVYRLKSPKITLAKIQLAIGISALVSVILYNPITNLNLYFYHGLNTTIQAFYMAKFINVVSGFLITAVTSAFIGATIPIVTNFLLDRNVDESCVSKVFASLILGLIVGYLVSINIYLPIVGLKNLICLGSLLPIMLGITILFFSNQKKSFVINTSIGTIIFISCIVGFIDFDIAKLNYISNHGAIDLKNNQLIYTKDGNFNSVALFKEKIELDRVFSVKANGYSVGSLGASEKVTFDEYRDLLTANLPMAINPEIESVAVLGSGTGLISHALLQHPGIKNVSTIEIEPAMLDVIQHIGNKVRNTIEDPRSQIIIDDPRVYVVNSNKKYDLIIANSTQYWQKNVAKLYSSEFYSKVKNNLGMNGLFVQLMNINQTDFNLLSAIMKAVSYGFKNYNLYTADNQHVLLVATNSDRKIEATEQIFSNENIKKSLTKVQINSAADLNVRFIGNSKYLYSYFDSSKINYNSDFFPYVMEQAHKQRFIGSKMTDLIEAQTSILASSLLESNVNVQQDVSFSHYFSQANIKRVADAILPYLEFGDQSESLSFNVRNRIDALRLSSDSCYYTDFNLMFEHLSNILHITIPFLSLDKMKKVWQHINPSNCYVKLNELEKQKINLFDFWIHRDYTNASIAASYMINNFKYLTKPEFYYAIGIYMMAQLQLDNPSAAYLAWVGLKNNYMYADLPTPIGIDLIKSYTYWLIQR